MGKKDKNMLDIFLDNYGTEKKVKYKRVYVKPDKNKCIRGFIFSLIFLIILLFIITFSFMYFLLLLGDLLIFLYYTINLFTERGIGLPKIVPYYEEDFEEKKDRYKV